MGQLIQELKRRNVIRVAIAYAIAAWLLIEVSATTFPMLRLPEWTATLVTVLLMIGFPVALIFAWAYELTPEGVKLEKHVDRSQSITHVTGHKLDYLIIAVLVLALGYFAFDKFVLDPSRDAELVQTTTKTVTEQAAESENAKPGDNSIAILPFIDLSPDGDQEYFSSGIAEEILNVLVRIDSLKVASRTSSFGFKGQEALGIPLIAEKLHVRNVLEGSVRKSGDKVRITAQLVDAETDKHLWSETYDRTLSTENIFAIQDEIAEAVVGQLGAIIDEGKGRAPAINVAADTQSLDAYELYLRAYQLFIERRTISESISLFEQSVAADPDFARAWAGLSAAYFLGPTYYLTDRYYRTLAADAAQKTIALNADLALPYAVLGMLARNELPADFTEAFAQFDEALKRDPKETTAWAWRGRTKTVIGDFAGAERDILRCLEIDPAYGVCQWSLAQAKLFAGDIEHALELVEQTMIRGVIVTGDSFISAYAARGNHAMVLALLAHYHAPLGQAPLIEFEYRAHMDPTFDFEEERAALEAIYLATTGEELDWNTGQWDGMTFGNYAALKPNEVNYRMWRPFPADFKTSPHRKRLMREIGLPEYWRENGFPPQCRPVGDDDFECD